METRLRNLAIIVGAAFLVVLVIVGYFAWMNIALVDTLHARLDGPVVQVRAPGMGRVRDLPVEIGDAVAQYEELGALEVLGISAQAGLPGRFLVPLRAPIAGIVVDKATQVGDMLSAGQAILTLADPDQVWVTANVHQTRIPQVRIGQPVRIRVNTRSLRRNFWGWVEQVGGVTNTALATGGSVAGTSTARAGEVPVRISIDPEGYTLYPGMMVDVRIKLDPRSLR